jgi:hypothetical protein
MLHHKPRSLASFALTVAAVAALAAAGPASAKTTTYPVSGKQTVVDEDNGIYKVSGGLIGDWTVTSFTELAATPLYKGKGTEHFKGCLDRGRDGSCANDPSGTLDFSFRLSGRPRSRAPRGSRARRAAAARRGSRARRPPPPRAAPGSGTRAPTARA